MITNKITLDLLAEEFNADLGDKRLLRCFTYRRNQLIISFSGKPERHLLFNAAKTSSYLHLSDGSGIPKKKPVVGILGKAENQRVLSIKSHILNRQLRVHLENEITIVFQFYGAQPNALLLDDSGLIIDAFKSATGLAGGMYEEKELKNERYTVPENPAELTEKLWKQPSYRLHVALKKVFTKVDGILSREILHIADIHPNTRSHGIDGHDAVKIWEAYEVVMSRTENPEPSLYLSDPPVFSIIELHHLSQSSRITYGSVNEAIVESLRAKRVFDSRQSRRKRAMRAVEIKIASVLNKIEKQGKDLERLKSRVDWTAIGDLIMANLNGIPAGVKEISLPAFEGEVTEEVKIELDPRLTPVLNARKYYSKSKKAKSGINKLKKAIAEGEHELAGLRELAERMTDLKDDEGWARVEKALAKRGLIRNTGKSDETPVALPYRSFRSPEGYDILVGKSARDNDTLTFRTAGKNDLWLHVQNGSGSHVIVKSKKSGESFPKGVINHAAELAARYSTQKKSGLVPVIYTLRKYVWKPRRSLPGVVSCKYEKSLIVKPAS